MSIWAFEFSYLNQPPDGAKIMSKASDAMQ